jgi:hypothetical protein
MDRFVLKNTFIKIYMYHFSINIFIKTRGQSYILETVSLSKMTLFLNMEGVYIMCRYIVNAMNLEMPKRLIICILVRCLSLCPLFLII